MKKFPLAFTSIAVLFGLTACNEQPAKSPTKAQDVTLEKLLHVPSPEWQDQVIYFLMTDRFSDGDPSNNDQGIGEYNPALENHFSGGDLQGVVNQLDYLENLGVTAVWTTPIVANQWWSTASNYGGYHGYWATDFTQVDKHLGSLETYQELSDKLHRRGMYLIQDIVVNHTGNFFNYKDGHNGYDANDTAKNFYLLEDPNSAQPAPVQPPFDMIDRNNPEHVAADIYNWTPSITDYNNLDHQFTYQLATLADLNTENPVVIDAMKQTYGDWIKKVGVDAFRIDTVKYVDNAFFHHFMHDDDGIHAIAKETGRDHFLAFGEIFDTSKPYDNKGERNVAKYFGSAEKPELNSVISFPLHHELKTVFAQGFPTDHLAYRIDQHMQMYPNPYTVPTFIDNHDMSRFLASGDVEGFKQALATIFTIPGIPTIYQGTAQAMNESRQAMFKGGFNADKDYFDQSSELYGFISEMAKIRTSDKLFTRGDIKQIAANKNGPGLLAYTRSYQGRTVLVMFNTSRNDILVNGVTVADSFAELKAMYGDIDGMQLNPAGKLTTELAGRSIVIAELVKAEGSMQIALQPPVINNQFDSQPIVKDFTLSGSATVANSEIKLVKNSRLDTAITVPTDAGGQWQYNYKVENLGEDKVSLIAYQSEVNLGSEPVAFTTLVTKAQQEVSFNDPANDDVGLTGNYLPPLHSQSVGQLDILAADVQLGGEVLKLTLTMRAVTDEWIPANGFDNVAFSLFFDLPNQQGGKVLPIINADIPQGWDWDLGHVVYGWGNTTFSAVNSDKHHQGEKFGVAPMASVDKSARKISFKYSGADFGIKNWHGSKVYITTWDITGEGVYREISSEASKWSMKGDSEHGPKILDELKIIIE